MLTWETLICFAVFTLGLLAVILTLSLAIATSVLPRGVVEMGSLSLHWESGLKYLL